jgi:hypothetical protein
MFIIPSFIQRVLCFLLTVLHPSFETCTGFWWEILKEKDNLKDHGVDGRMGSKLTLGRLFGGVWSGFSWLRIGTVGGRVCMR